MPMRAMKMVRYAWVRLKQQVGIDHFPAHDGLDRKMLAYLGQINQGIFVEAGANDGLAHSNTWHLEQRLGWRGLLVEPVPENAALCRQFRSAAVECCALGGPDQDGTVVSMHFGAGMSAAEGADLAHLSGGSAEAHANIGAGWIGRKSYKFDAPVVALSRLLDKWAFTAVDFLSLDVEGFEVQALSGIDLDRHPIRYILVESSNVDAVKGVLGSKYKLIDKLSHHDYLFERQAIES